MFFINLKSYSLLPKANRMDLVTFKKQQRKLEKQGTKERVLVKSLDPYGLLSDEYCIIFENLTLFEKFERKKNWKKSWKFKFHCNNLFLMIRMMNWKILTIFVWIVKNLTNSNNFKVCRVFMPNWLNFMRSKAFKTSKISINSQNSLKTVEIRKSTETQKQYNFHYQNPFKLSNSTKSLLFALFSLQRLLAPFIPSKNFAPFRDKQNPPPRRHLWIIEKAIRCLSSSWLLSMVQDLQPIVFRK